MPGLEAAACRCPLVATECGGVADFVREGVNGHLVPVGDWQAMADRIERLLTRPAVEWRRMSSASHDIAREFDWDRSAELLEAFLLTLLPGRVVVAS
jgi:glycosyltransferase involved in cell wall biosynthesis